MYAGTLHNKEGQKDSGGRDGWKVSRNNNELTPGETKQGNLTSRHDTYDMCKSKEGTASATISTIK
jgi:hypothetical protein